MHPNIIVVAQRQLEDPNGLFTQSLRAKVPLPLQDDQLFFAKHVDISAKS